MEKLDLTYVTGLVPLIRAGDMNAFAEFYAATCRRQYAFALDILKDSFSAQAALEDTYVEFLKTLNRLNDDALVIAWLSRICFVTCARSGHGSSDKFESQIVNISGVEYSVRRIMNLPLTEGQVLLLNCLCHMKPSTIARYLEISLSAVRHYSKEGKHRLMIAPNAEGGAEK